MRQTSVRKVPHLLTLAALTAAVGIGGCKKKETETKADETEAEAAEAGGAEDAGEAADGGGSADGGDAADGGSAPGGVLPVLDEPLAHEKGVVLGHVLLPNPAQLLTDLKAYAPPEASGFLDEAALKALLGMQAGERAKVVQAVDLKKPHGCAVVDYKAYEDAPVSCAIAYTGGAKQFVADMGDAGKVDAEGHVAAYEFEGQKIYIDDLGEYMGVTGYPDLFEKTKTYLEKNIVARGTSPRGDIEAVAYVGDLFDVYEAELKPFLDKMSEQQDLGATSDPRFAQLQKLYADYNKRNSERTVDQFKDMQQITIDLGVDDRGLLMGLTMVSAPDSEAAKLAKDFGGGHVDPKLASTLPKGTWMMMTSHNERGAYKSPQAQDAMAMLTDGWAALTGQDAAAGKVAVQAFFEESEKLYSPDSALGLAAVDGGLFGAVLVAQAKAPTRDAWLAWSKTFTTEAVLGAEGAKYVSWSFEPEHAKVGDVAVDRWTIEPSADARKGIEKDMSDKDREQIKKYVGDLKLVIDRAEVGNNVTWTIAPKAEDTWTKRVVEAQQGKEALASDPGLTAAMGYHGGAAMVMGVDINGMFDWMRAIPDLGDTMKKVPNDLGENLSDVMFVMEYRKDGVSTVDFLVSEAVIKDAVKLGSQLGGPGQAPGGLGGL